MWNSSSSPFLYNTLWKESCKFSVGDNYSKKPRIQWRGGKGEIRNSLVECLINSLGIRDVKILLFLILSNFDFITLPFLPQFPHLIRQNLSLWTWRIISQRNHRSEEFSNLKITLNSFLKTVKWKTDENIVGKMRLCLYLLKESFLFSDLSQMATKTRGEEAQPPSKPANVNSSNAI